MGLPKEENAIKRAFVIFFPHFLCNDDPTFCAIKRPAPRAGTTAQMTTIKGKNRKKTRENKRAFVIFIYLFAPSFVQLQRPACRPQLFLISQ